MFVIMTYKFIQYMMNAFIEHIDTKIFLMFLNHASNIIQIISILKKCSKSQIFFKYVSYKKRINFNSYILINS